MSTRTGTELHTDALKSYEGLETEYGRENVWSLLKRALKGTYVSVEPYRLFRCLDEQTFRFNERKDTDAGRFAKVLLDVQ